VLHYAVNVYKKGNLAHALELLEDLQRGGKSGLLYGTIGYLLVESGDYEKALAYNLEAVDYDDEDAILLDNLAQVYYRLGNDKAAAKPWFDKAHAIKPDQIDTLWFLAQYDLDAGDRPAARDKLERALKGRFSPLNYATKEKVEAELRKLETDKEQTEQI